MRSRLLVLVGALALVTWACAPSGTGEAPPDDAPADTEAPATTAVQDQASEETAAEPSGEPIRVGGSLALTGPLAPTEDVPLIVEL